jgi:hypothetical protein
MDLDVDINVFEIFTSPDSSKTQKIKTRGLKTTV